MFAETASREATPCWVLGLGKQRRTEEEKMIWKRNANDTDGRERELEKEINKEKE